MVIMDKDVEEVTTDKGAAEEIMARAVRVVIMVKDAIVEIIVKDAIVAPIQILVLKEIMLKLVLILQLLILLVIRLPKQILKEDFMIQFNEKRNTAVLYTCGICNLNCRYCTIDKNPILK